MNPVIVRPDKKLAVPNPKTFGGDGLFIFIVNNISQPIATAVSPDFP